MGDRLSDALCFREASGEDIPAILAIHNANVRRANSSEPSLPTGTVQEIEAQGFLLAEMKESELRQKLGSSHRFFLALSQATDAPSEAPEIRADSDSIEEHPNPQENIPVGYVSTSTPNLTTESLQSIHWVSDFDPTQLMGDRHVYIQVVAVCPQWTGRGIGRFIYQSIYQTFPNSCLSLFVATKPLRNERSLNFHYRQGFRPVGTFRSPQLIDLKDYESLLFFREAQAVLNQQID